MGTRCGGRSTDGRAGPLSGRVHAKRRRPPLATSDASPPDTTATPSVYEKQSTHQDRRPVGGRSRRRGALFCGRRAAWAARRPPPTCAACAVGQNPWRPRGRSGPPRRGAGAPVARPPPARPARPSGGRCSPAARTAPGPSTSETPPPVAAPALLAPPPPPLRPTAAVGGRRGRRPAPTYQARPTGARKAPGATLTDRPPQRQRWRRPPARRPTLG
jgi:hypothetical protein